MFRMVPSNGVPVSAGLFIKALPGVFASESGVCRFERAFESYIGRGHATATWSGRSALTLALTAFRDAAPEKDEVLIPALTCESVYYAVHRAGLKPVLYDIDPATLGSSAERCAEMITGRTLCVIAVAMYGIAVDMGSLRTVCDREGCFLLEDVSQSLGAAWQGRRLGTFGHAAVFSFGKSKNISTIQGGLVLASDDSVHGAVRKRIAGWERPGLLDRLMLAGTFVIYSFIIRPVFFRMLTALKIPFADHTFNIDFRLARMGPFQAALGRLMLRQLDALNAIRRKYGRLLRETLSTGRIAVLPEKLEQPGGDSVYLRLPVIINDPAIRKERIRTCNAVGVWAGASAYRPLYRLTGDPADNYPETARTADATILVPTHPYLNDRDIRNICAILTV